MYFYLQMDNKNFIKADNNVIVKKQSIRWMKKMDECILICSKSTGCSTADAHRVCEINNSVSYALLNKQFQLFDCHP